MSLSPSGSTCAAVDVLPLNGVCWASRWQEVRVTGADKAGVLRGPSGGTLLPPEELIFQGLGWL